MTDGLATAAVPKAPQDAHRGRLFRKYLLLILSLVTLVLLASSGINLYFSYQENRAALASLQQEKAVGAASRIEQYVRQVSQQLGYASLPQLDASDVEARRIEFLKLLRQAPEVTDISQLDATGREVIAVSRLGMDIVASSRDRSADAPFLQARRGQPWFGPVYFRKETEPYMTVAIRSGGGDRGPVTVAEVNLKFIWDVVSRIRIGDKGKAYVVDATGLLVADPDIGLVLRKTNLGELAHVKAAAGPQNPNAPAMLSHDLRHTPVLASFAPIETLGWKVFVEQPIAEVYAKLNASILRTGLLLLAGLLVSALAASALARSMVRPIRTLDEGARRIGAGELDQHITIRTGDELEGLADQFNRMTGQLRESYAGLERKVEERTAEVTEALERQTATSEVLRVISGSVADAAPVFDAILDSCERLFGAADSGIFLTDENLALRIGALRGILLDTAAHTYPRPLAGTMSGLAIERGSVLHVPDFAQAKETPAYIRELAQRSGNFSVAVAPMMWEGRGIGTIDIIRTPPRPYTEKELALLETFADQAVIAIQNARLFNETREALEQQTATAEILQVISSSPTDVQPVFDAIAERAMTLCGARIGGVTRLDGEQLRLVAYHGGSPEATAAVHARFPAHLDRGTLTGRAILEGVPVQIADVLADPEYALKDAARIGGYRGNLAVPMLREGRVVGAIGVSREEPGVFPDKQVRLLQTFADQAVIAIENVRLFNETKEALERQTATSEILQVIGSSVADTAPVFDKILDSCQRLFATEQLGVFVTRDDGLVHVAAWRGSDLAAVVSTFPKPLEQTATGVAIRERRTLHYDSAAHAADAPATVRDVAQRIGDYSVAWSPMLWEDRGVGSIAVLRRPPKPFTADEMALLKTFADQAAIAIRNARLFNETQEALERQTATAEVLKVISSSPTDTKPVFEAIGKSALHLFDGLNVAVGLIQPDGQLDIEALAGDLLTAQGDSVRDLFPVPLDRDTLMGQAILDRNMLNVADVQASAAPERSRMLGVKFGYHSMMAAPMLREHQPIGAIGVMRAAHGGFTPKEIDQLRTFADQAVIAIENVRLFNETKEALEHQTATSEVLRVISSSVADTQPVFEKILLSCSSLFDSNEQGVLLIGGDGKVTLGAHRGAAKARTEAYFAEPHAAGEFEKSIRERRLLYFRDVLGESDVPSGVRAAARHMGIGTYSQAFAPMAWEDKAVGSLYVTRSSAAGFSEKELALLKTFADQAVIAIQNARLFHEIQDKSRQLEVANKHKSDFLANMSHELRTPLNAIIGFSEVLAEQMFGDVNEKQLDYLKDIHSSGHHLLTLINDILDLSKIEAGRMELELSSFDLGLLLDNSMTLVRERASRHGLTLALDVADDIDEWVADQRKVKQVVINLLSNAVKFTPAGGKVTLRARRVESTSGGDADAGSAIEIAVIDTGVGIAPDQQALVFEEFRQASGDYLRKSEGTGLGLALAKRFVELHGGRIRVESLPGHGSTFAFVLPQRVLEVV
jgi:signal transduction histidine kinase